MTTKSDAEATQRADALAAAMTEMRVPDFGASFHRHPRSQLAQANGFAHFYGKIAFTARTSSGTTWVQFNDEINNVGVASEWPEWAYAQAEKALLADRHLFLITNGDPIGSALVLVSLENH